MLLNLQEELFENIPNQDKSDEKKFKLSEYNIEKWFQNLPQAKIKSSAKYIYRTLKYLNTIKINYHERLSFLEKIHNYVVNLSYSLEKENLERGFPLSHEHHLVSVLLHKLHGQMSLAYKITLRDKVQSFNMIKSHDIELSLIIDRALRHNSLSLFIDFLLYEKAEKGLWKDTHNLFLYACHKKIEKNIVSDPSLRLRKETSVKESYLQVVLLSMIDPFHFCQYEIGFIYNMLEEWVRYSDLSLCISSDDIIIDLSKDSCPVLINNCVEQKGFYWGVNISLLDKVTMQKALKNQNSRIGKEIIKHILFSWGKTLHREDVRVDTKDENYLNALMGIDNIFLFLERKYKNKSNDQINPLETLNLELESIDGNDDNSRINAKTWENYKPEKEHEDMWNKYFVKENYIEEINISYVKKSYCPENDINPDKWEILNQSKNGVCLSIKSDKERSIKVGNIISLKSHGNGNSWSLGIIKWMKCIADNEINIGINIITTKISPVSIVFNNEHYKGILLPSMPLLNKPKTIITNALSFKENQHFNITKHKFKHETGKIIEIKNNITLIKELDSSSHYSIFSYETLKKNNDEEKTSNKKAFVETINNELELEYDQHFEDMMKLFNK